MTYIFHSSLLKNLLSILFFTLSFYLGSAAEAPKISLLTYEVGDQSHTIFGHTAIRVQDPIYQTDWVYNYGVFDFDTPYFLLKFAKGSAQYKLGIQEFDQAIRSYFNENRQVYEQELNLTEQQRKKLLHLLQVNYRPENRYYRYGFLKNNCSTKVRDLLLTSFENTTYSKEPTNRTFRSYINEYMQPTPWYKFGANLLLGSKIDYNIDTWELMFLPDFLSEEVTKATIGGKPLAEKQQAVFENISPTISSRWKITPFVVFSLVFVIMVLGRSKYIIQTFTLIIGLTGLFALGLNFISEHPEVQANYNLLWCNPLYLLSFGLCFTQWKKFHRTLAFLLLGCIGIAIFIGVSKIQGYIPAFFPVILSLVWINLKQLTRK